MTDTSKTESERILEQVGLLSWLGIDIVEEGDGRVLLELPHRRELTNRDGETIHGGVIATLIDNAAGAAVRTTFESPETTRHATVELNLSYLRPATGDLRAEAEVRRRGSSIASIQIDVDGQLPDGEWKTVAVGRASYFVDVAD